MTNLQSVAGSFIWAAIAVVLMLATFEPVKSEQAQGVQLSARTGAVAGQASL